MAFTTDVINALQNKINESSDDAIVFGRHEFLKTKTWIAAPVVFVLVLASVVGTFGNVFILAVVCSNTLGRNVTTTFITNLAISDLFMTLVADPMNVVGRLYSHFANIATSERSTLLEGRNEFRKANKSSDPETTTRSRKPNTNSSS